MAKVKKWVLVVDDDSEVVDHVSEVIKEKFGDLIAVIRAANGYEGLTKIELQAFDCIITDMAMPKKSGDAFIKLIKNSQLNKHTPIIVISGKIEGSVIGKKFPNVTFFPKPLNNDELMKCIHNQIQLGKTNERVSAGLLNNLIDATSELAKQVAKSEARRERPQIKMSSQDPAGDELVVFSLKVGRSLSLAALGFSESFVPHLLKTFCKDQENANNKAALEAAARFVFHLAAKGITKETGSPCALVSKVYIESKEHPQYQYARTNRGLAIPFETDRGVVFLHTFIDESSSRALNYNKYRVVS